MSNTLMLKDCRLSYNALFEAQDFQNNGDFAYTAKIIVPKASQAAKDLYAALLAVANEKFNGKGQEIIAKIKSDPSQFCLQEFDDEHFVLATKRKQKAGRPTVVDADRTPLTADDGKPYPGCFVNVIVGPWATSGMGNRHWVRCGLEGVQFVRDGEPFGRRVSANSFDDLSQQGGSQGAGEFL